MHFPTHNDILYINNMSKFVEGNKMIKVKSASKIKKIFILTFLSVLLFVSAVGCDLFSDENSETPPAPSSEVPAEKPAPPTPAQIKETFIKNTMDGMTQEEKVGQLFFVKFRTDANGQPIHNITEDIEKTIRDVGVGGIILFAENIDTADQTKTLIADFKKAGKLPVFIATDEEGGRISRLSASGKLDVAKSPTPGSVGKSGNTQKAYDMMATIAKEMKALGFNLDFAPDADINTNPKNTVIGDRAFGTDPNKTADMVSEALKGLTQNGIIATVKHFPGHGDTTTDPHKGETVVTHDMKRLQREEFIPFKRAIKDGVNFIMVAHIKTPNVTKDNLPASMSKEMVTDILRGQLGYKNVVITDALDMGAISKYYSPGDVAVNCINAGVDMLLMPADLSQAHRGIMDALANGKITQQRIDESVERILSVKYDAGLFN